MSLYYFTTEPKGDYTSVTISANRERLEETRKDFLEHSNEGEVGEIKETNNNPNNWEIFQSNSPIEVSMTKNKEGGKCLYGYNMKDGKKKIYTISSSRETAEDLRHDDNLSLGDEEGPRVEPIEKLGTEVTIRSLSYLHP